MSDNAEWYSDFYKEHKRKPNKAELLEMAREVYMGNGMKYGMAEYQFEATDEMQEDFDALDQEFANLEALNNIKDKTSDLTASEMAVMQGLSPSGYKVYQTARKQFAQGNAEVQKAGRMNAILFARYTDRMADNISKITGREYTAEDYMRERMHIVADATEVDENGYNLPVTNPAITLDTRVKGVHIKSILKGENWRDARNNYFANHSDIVKSVITDKNNKQRHAPYVNEISGAKVVVSKDSVGHVLSDGTSTSKENKELLALRQSTYQQEIVAVLPEIIKKGILIEEHADKHRKADRVYRLFCPVKYDGNELAVVKLTLKKEKTIYHLVDGEKTSFRASDASYQNKKELGGDQRDYLDSEFTHEGNATKPFL